MSKKVTRVGVFVSLAMIFSYIEAIIPFNFGIPGVKLGIANIVVVVSLYRLSIAETAGISFVRILLIGLLFGNIMSLAYSFSGGCLSLFGMIVCKRLKLSVIGVSMVGGVLHNMGQLVAAMLILKNAAISYYMPVLIVSGLLTGFLIGFAASIIVSRVAVYR